MLPLYDTRKADRLAVALPLTYVIECGPERLEGHADTIDIGGGGVRFLISRMVSPRTMCQLTLMLPDQTEPLLLTAQVSWCRQVTTRGCDRFELGVAFVISPADDTAMFGHYCQFIASQLLLKHVR